MWDATFKRPTHNVLTYILGIQEKTQNSVLIIHLLFLNRHMIKVKRNAAKRKETMKMPRFFAIAMMQLPSSDPLLLLNQHD